jgi:hypothetical protein
MIRDGAIPKIRAIACNNGLRWHQNAQAAIKRVDADFGDQVTWEYVNHDVLLNLLQRIKTVDETLHLTGKAIVEDMNYSRVCIGRIPVIEVAELMQKHGERLLERNIRRYLGLHGNRVNQDIKATLFREPDNFYFFNNGLTIICNSFSYNALQSNDNKIRLKNMQIVNGGQTCMTIFHTLEAMRDSEIFDFVNAPLLENIKNASVLVRIYELPEDKNTDIGLQITQATNNQNPVDLKDLRANEEKQIALEQSIELLGYHYRRKRSNKALQANEITAGTTAEAILAVWRKSPHQAKFMTREHFGKLYPVIFTETLNGTQAVIAVLLYRIAENRRRRPAETDPFFVRYASCFIAMQMGKKLLTALNITLEKLDHNRFKEAKILIEQQGEQFFNQAITDIKQAIIALYGERDVSIQQLAATFRRGDLISLLEE